MAEISRADCLVNLGSSIKLLDHYLEGVIMLENKGQSSKAREVATALTDASYTPKMVREHIAFLRQQGAKQNAEHYAHSYNELRKCAHQEPIVF